MRQGTFKCNCRPNVLVSGGPHRRTLQRTGEQHQDVEMCNPCPPTFLLPISPAAHTLNCAKAPLILKRSLRNFTIEFLSSLNVTIPAGSALFRPLPWLLILSNKKLLQMALAYLNASLIFYVCAIQSPRHLPCKRRP